MDTGIDLVVTIGIFCTVGSFLIAYFLFGRTKARDSQEDGAKTAQITSDMGYIKNGIEGINQKLEKQDERHVQVVERLCTVETSTKAAHKRIDTLESEGRL